LAEGRPVNSFQLRADQASEVEAQIGRALARMAEQGRQGSEDIGLSGCLPEHWVVRLSEGGV